MTVREALKTKMGAAAVTFASVALAGSVVAASANNGHNNGHNNGYGKEQCKNGGWRNFTDPQGNPLFKNQGDCVSFFATGGKNRPSGDTNNSFNTNATNTTDLKIKTKQHAQTGDANARNSVSGDAVNGVSNTVNLTTSATNH